MTDNEHIHPKLKIQRITPKSEFLLELEKRTFTSVDIRGKFSVPPGYKIIYPKPGDHPLLEPQWRDMVSVYTGSDLNHFRSESIPTYKSSK